MPEVVDRSSLHVVANNPRLECYCNAFYKSGFAGLIGLFLPVPILKYIKIIPSNIQSKTLLAFVGCTTLSMLVLNIELDRCPPEKMPGKTASG